MTNIVAEETWHTFLKVHQDILRRIDNEEEEEKEEGSRFEVIEIYLSIRTLLQSFLTSWLYVTFYHVRSVILFVSPLHGSLAHWYGQDRK